MGEVGVEPQLLLGDGLLLFTHLLLELQFLLQGQAAVAEPVEAPEQQQQQGDVQGVRRPGLPEGWANVDRKPRLRILRPGADPERVVARRYVAVGGQAGFRPRLPFFLVTLQHIFDRVGLAFGEAGERVADREDIVGIVQVETVGQEDAPVHREEAAVGGVDHGIVYLHLVEQQPARGRSGQEFRRFEEVEAADAPKGQVASALAVQRRPEVVMPRLEAVLGLERPHPPRGTVVVEYRAEGGEPEVIPVVHLHAGHRAVGDLLQRCLLHELPRPGVKDDQPVVAGRDPQDSVPLQHVLHHVAAVRLVVAPRRIHQPALLDVVLLNASLEGAQPEYPAGHRSDRADVQVGDLHQSFHPVVRRPVAVESATIGADVQRPVTVIVEGADIVDRQFRAGTADGELPQTAGFPIVAVDTVGVSAHPEVVGGFLQCEDGAVTQGRNDVVLQISRGRIEPAHPPAVGAYPKGPVGRLLDAPNAFVAEGAQGVGGPFGDGAHLFAGRIEYVHASVVGAYPYVAVGLCVDLAHRAVRESVLIIAGRKVTLQSVTFFRVDRYAVHPVAAGADPQFFVAPGVHADVVIRGQQAIQPPVHRSFPVGTDLQSEYPRRGTDPGV